jgi:hypothetical protein
MKMEWLQAFMIAGSTIGACFWMHRENLQNKADHDKEMKEFHGRLCTLEERYLQMMQRILERRE